MTQQQENTVIRTILEIINENGLDARFIYKEMQGPYVPKVSMRKEVSNDIRSKFNAPNPC